MSAQLTYTERMRLRSMAAAVARANSLPERVKAELRRGPATLAELCACVMPDMSDRSYDTLRAVMNRMRKRGEIKRVPMQTWSGRRVQIAEVMVWTLVEQGGVAA